MAYLIAWLKEIIDFTAPILESLAPNDTESLIADIKEGLDISQSMLYRLLVSTILKLMIIFIIFDGIIL